VCVCKLPGLVPIGLWPFLHVVEKLFPCSPLGMDLQKALWVLGWCQCWPNASNQMASFYLQQKPRLSTLCNSFLGTPHPGYHRVGTAPVSGRSLDLGDGLRPFNQGGGEWPNKVTWVSACPWCGYRSRVNWRELFLFFKTFFSPWSSCTQANHLYILKAFVLCLFHAPQKLVFTWAGKKLWGCSLIPQNPPELLPLLHTANEVGREPQF
jgi:hypothetical protein